MKKVCCCTTGYDTDMVGLITVLRYVFCPHTIGRYLLNYNVFMFHDFMMYVVSYSKIMLAYIVFDCDTHSLCRWPWNLFRLMRVPLGQARGDRAAIATQLLNADEGSLESATKQLGNNVCWISATFPTLVDFHWVVGFMLCWPQ